jgi:hypothetical protein
MEDSMEDREEIKSFLMELIGEEGCGVSCDDAEVFFDEDAWKLRLEGFMEPWTIGKTVSEAKRNLQDLANQGYGLS